MAAAAGQGGGLMSRLRDAWRVLRGRARVIPLGTEGEVFLAATIGGEAYGGKLQPPFDRRALRDASRALTLAVEEKLPEPEVKRALRRVV